MAVEFLRLLDALDCIGMRHVAGFAAAQRVEVFSPFGRDAGRIAQVVFVELFDERGIAARELGGLGKLLEEIDAHAYLPEWSKRVRGCGTHDISVRSA